MTARLYDERKPLEPTYSTIPASQTGEVYATGEISGTEELMHAPPGYVFLVNEVLY
jgi:hypothetical protein